MAQQNTLKHRQEIHGKPEGFEPIRTIYVCVDDSTCSDKAVQYTIKTLINPSSDLVVLLNVRKSIVDHWNLEALHPLTNDPFKEAEQGNVDSSTEILNKYAKIFKAHGVYCQSHILVGDAREAIEKEIEEGKPSFVVMGSRGNGMIGRALLGSVSTHVLHHSTSPVLIVPE